MWRMVAVLSVFSIGVLAQTPPVQAETEEEVSLLTKEQVGPYRPDNVPQLEDVEEKIVERTNDFRRSNDRDVLSRNDVLDQTAEDFAEFMATNDRYGHTADGKQPHERIEAHNYEYCQVAENIAYFFRTDGYATAELAKEAVQGWINSPGHRKNMLRPDVTEIGLGVAQSDETNVFYAVQLFGRPRSLRLEFAVVNQSAEEVIYKLDDQEFSLEPRFTRTHQICLPQDVNFLKNNESKASFSPTDGAAYFVTSVEGELSVREGTLEEVPGGSDLP